jgi:hypothetical protein
LIDAAAIGRDSVTGRTATINDKYNAVREVFDRITDSDAPSWNKVREGGAGTVTGGLLVAALMQLKQKDNATIVEWLSSKTNEEKAALRKNPKVAEVIESLRVAKVKTDGIDTDSLLDELMD